MITRGLEAATKGMMSLLKQEDVNANNLANVNTVGFKKTNITFKDLMQADVEVKQVPVTNNPKDTQFIRVGSLSLGNGADRTYIDFSQGGLITTGNKLDIGIQGKGFFKIRHQNVPDNIPYDESNYYYTRAGNFQMTDDYYLVTKEGDWVMDTQNRRIRIVLNPEDPNNNPNNRIDSLKDISIGENGVIQITNPNNARTLQQIQIVDFDHKELLSAQLGESKYVQQEGIDAGMRQSNQTARLQQGMLEGSNTNTIYEMINTITVTRSYEAMAKVVRTQGDTVSRAINLGVVNR